MYVVICLDINSFPTFDLLDDEMSALEKIKSLAEKGATKIILAKKYHLKFKEL